MLEKGKGPAKPFAFLVAVDVQDFVDMEQVKFRLADSVNCMEGCGKTDVESLGPIDVYEEPVQITEKDVNV